MTEPLTSGRLLVLGLLLERPTGLRELAETAAERGSPLGARVTTIARELCSAGFVTLTEHTDDTLAELTDHGREGLETGLAGLIADPGITDPPFGTTIGYLGALPEQVAKRALRERVRALESLPATTPDPGIPRLFRIEDEYSDHMGRSELDWVRAVADELDAGTLAWPEVTVTDEGWQWAEEPLVAASSEIQPAAPSVRPMTENSLRGRTALVTGASRGIGAAIAAELARRGAAVAVNYLASETDARKVVAGIEEHGGRAVTVRADITDEDSVRRMVAEVEDGLGPVDILVLNSSGYRDVLRGPALNHPVEALVDKMATQARATLGPAYAVLPGMVERRSGSVILVSDSFSRQAAAGAIGHAVAKAPMEAAMKHLAIELGPHNVRINTVIPGATRSENLMKKWDKKDEWGRTIAWVVDQTPLRRLGEPEDVARAVAVLAGDELAYITGAFLPVSGGHLIL